MKCAVIGSPIAHSRSPQIHRAAYESLGIDWQYSIHNVGAEDVVGFISILDTTWRGLSVTMPCKQAILSVGTPDKVVEALGVGNTVIFDGIPSARSTTRIHNTDVSGIMMLLGHCDPESRFQVMGNGATARSCIYALAQLGVSHVQVRARDDTKTALLTRDGHDWGIEITPPDGEVDTVVSTVPGNVAVSWLEVIFPQLVVDVLYNPWPPLVAREAHARGIEVITGLDLLAAQAVGQVELMTGQRVEFSLLRQAAEKQ